MQLGVTSMVSIAGYMVDIADPQEWNFTGTSVIPANDLHLPRANAFYIGGNTPHVWDKVQIARQSNDYRLPIWVYDPTRSGGTYGQRDGVKAATICLSLGMPRDKQLLICLDMETYIDEDYTAAFHNALVTSGYWYVVYESESVQASRNVTGSVGAWTASWDGKPHIDPGAWATQYADSRLLNHPFDISAVSSFDHLWNIRATEKPPVTAPVITRHGIVVQDDLSTFPVQSVDGKRWELTPGA